MIIASIFEGLGNQMFQYAAARYLAEKHSTVLKLDLSSFELNKRRKYSLHCFNIQENIATQNEVDDLLKKSQKKGKNLIKKILGRSATQTNTGLLQERYFHFDPYILEAPNNVYLNGYWQSEKYFSEIRDILLSEFTFKYPQTSQNRELSEKIRLNESISLHVRRGDFIRNKETYQFHSICSLDYYQHCIDYISREVNKPYFLIFSDDQEWVRANIQLNFPFTIVENNNGFRSYEDLRLMSECQHNIIANSSFSWWGAWLNSNPGKIICTPEQWFKEKISGTKYLLPEGFIPIYKDNHVDIKDLIPESWLKF
jgi:hypothetical protein